MGENYPREREVNRMVVKKTEVILEVSAYGLEELRTIINSLDDQTMLILPFYNRKGCEIGDCSE